MQDPREKLSGAVGDSSATSAERTSNSSQQTGENSIVPIELESNLAYIKPGDTVVDMGGPSAKAITPQLEPDSVDVIHSSHDLHQIVIHGDDQFGRYNLASVQEALRNWAISLKPGGLLIIRDFLAPDDGNNWYLELKTAEARAYFRRFVPTRRRHEATAAAHRPLRYTMPRDHRVTMPPADALEFMLSMRFGMLDEKEHERVLQEQFTHFTHAAYRALVEAIVLDGYRLEIVEDHSYATADYLDFWRDHLDVFEMDHENRPLPFAAIPLFIQLIVAKKVVIDDDSSNRRT